VEKINLPMTENIYSKPLLERHWLSKKAFEIVLERPANFDFQPGQRIQIFHEDIERDYSLSSAPSDRQLALCIRHIEGGAMSSVLGRMDIGIHIAFAGPFGYFVFQSVKRKPIFVATGTGIAPFCCMLRSGIRDVTLLHGARNPEELYYASEIKKTVKHYVACLSDASAGDTGYFQGRVTDYLQKELPRDNYDFYLCGGGKMIRDVILLVDERFPGSNIYTEPFY
jgi:ferredoxin-NADP reductase